MSKEMNAQNIGYIVLCGKGGEAPFHTAKANCKIRPYQVFIIVSFKLLISAQINNSDTQIQCLTCICSAELMNLIFGNS